MDFTARQAPRVAIGGYPAARCCLAAALYLAVVPGAATAQTYVVTPEAPNYHVSDENDVELVSGFVTFTVPDVQIGGDIGLANTVSNVNYSAPYSSNPAVNGFASNLPLRTPYIGGLTQTNQGGAPAYAPSYISFSFGGISESFSGTLATTTYNSSTGQWTTTVAPAGTVFTTISKNGGKLTSDGNNIFTYVDRNGATYTVNYALPQYTFAQNALYPVTAVQYPTGRKLNVYYANGHLQSVTNGNGFQLFYRYDGAGLAVGVTALNNAFEYCNPTASSCSPAQQWPASSYTRTGSTIFTVTDQANRDTRFTMNSYSEVTSVKPKEKANDSIFYEYCSRSGFSGPCSAVIYSGGVLTTYKFPGKTYRVTRNGVTRDYSFQPNVGGGWYSSYSGAHPYFGTKEVLSGSAGPITYVKEDDGTKLSFQADGPNHVYTISRPDLSSVDFTYDDRSNLLTKKQNPVQGDPSTPLTIAADYPATCANIVICNKPTAVRDANQNQTDYVYDPVHGGVISETGPAVNGIRPQKRFEYVQRTPWFLNSSGVQTAGSPIWLLSAESYCRTSAASGSGCALAGDEVRITYEYGPDSGPNNLFLRGKAVTADGTTLRTCFAYDKYGNKISETKPNANLAVCP